MMITCIAPTSLEETIQSMSYTTRAMNIENRPMRNIMEADQYGKTRSCVRNIMAESCVYGTKRVWGNIRTGVEYGKTFRRDYLPNI